MYTKSLQGEIIFYYPHADLFDDVKHQSAFMTKNIVSKEGEDLSERFMITDDEEGMFELCLRESLPDIYEQLKPLTHGIDHAFDGDAEHTPVVNEESPEVGSAITGTLYANATEQTETVALGLDLADGEVVKTEAAAATGYVLSGRTYYSRPGTKVVIIRTVDHGAYNPNDITQVDSTLRSAIGSGVLSQFYTRVVNKDLTQVSEAQFQAQIVSLLRRMKGLRRKTVL